VIYTFEDRMPFDTGTHVYFSRVIIRRGWLVMLVCMTVGLAQTVDAAPVALSAYNSACGVSIRHQDETLVMHWKTLEGATELTLNLSSQGAVVSSIAGPRRGEARGHPVRC